MGLNYSMTGVFYNKALAEQDRHDQRRRRRVAELDDLLAKAKAAGIHADHAMEQAERRPRLPAAEPDGRLRRPGPINDWIFQKPDATIDTPSNLEPPSISSSGSRPAISRPIPTRIDYATMMSRFIGGNGLFLFNGDWESGNLDKQMAGNAGFFLMPPAEAGGKHAAMSAPLTYGIGAKAKNPDCAAFFLNWVATNDEARKINVEVGGSNPGGPAEPADARGRAGLA